MNELYINFSFILSILIIIDSSESLDKQGDTEEFLFFSFIICWVSVIFKTFSLFISDEF